jgi:hypothetical protein
VRPSSDLSSWYLGRPNPITQPETAREKAWFWYRMVPPSYKFVYKVYKVYKLLIYILHLMNMKVYKPHELVRYIYCTIHHSAIDKA